MSENLFKSEAFRRHAASIGRKGGAAGKGTEATRQKLAKAREALAKLRAAKKSFAPVRREP
jgi:hypothetical protein